MLIASALSHVTQHSSHRSRKPQKQTVHPLSYPSTLHFPKYHLLLRNISPYFSPLPTAKKPSLLHQFSGGGGGGVLLGNFGSVPPGSPNPDPNTDQNIPFSTPVFRPGLENTYPFSDLCCYVIKLRINNELKN